MQKMSCFIVFSFEEAIISNISGEMPRVARRICRGMWYNVSKSNGGLAHMKRIAVACFLATLAAATVYGKPVTGSSSASSSISIEEMSSSDIEKAFGGSGFGGSFGGKGFSFGQGVASYTGKPSVVLRGGWFQPCEREYGWFSPDPQWHG